MGVEAKSIHTHTVTTAKVVRMCLLLMSLSLAAAQCAVVDAVVVVDVAVVRLDGSSRFANWHTLAPKQSCIIHC